MESHVENRAEKRVLPLNDRRAKFTKLAENRTVNAIKAIRVIGKLANKASYDFSDGDVKKIVSALTREIDALKSRFTQKSNKNGVEFKL